MAGFNLAKVLAFPLENPSGGASISVLWRGKSQGLAPMENSETAITVLPGGTVVHVFNVTEMMRRVVNELHRQGREEDGVLG